MWRILKLEKEPLSSDIYTKYSKEQDKKDTEKYKNVNLKNKK